MCRAIHITHGRGDRLRPIAAALVCLAYFAMGDPGFSHELVTPTLPAPFDAGLTAGPYNFEFTDSDSLRVSAATSLSGARCEIHYRVKMPGRDAIITSEPFAPTADRVLRTHEWTMGRGYLLNVVAVISAGAPKRGQFFVKLEAIRGSGNNATLLGTLLAGYITANQPVAWPGSPIEAASDGDGYQRVITGTAPGVGVEFSESVPTGARWEVVNWSVTLDTEGAAGLRRPGILFDDGVTVYFRSPIPTTQDHSITVIHYWTQGAPYVTSILSDVGVGNLPLGNRLLAGHRIRSATNNFQPGDVYHGPIYIVREWLDV